MTPISDSDENAEELQDESDDRSLDEILSTEAGKETLKSKLTKKYIKYAAGALAVLFIVFCVISCQPRKGPLVYGVCSTFLDLNVQYPQTLNYLDTEMSQTAVRIYFTQIDPFGQLKQEMLECKFGADKRGYLKVTAIERNRKPVDPTIVEKFNQTLPAIVEGKPYLVLPPEWKNPLVRD